MSGLNLYVLYILLGFKCHRLESYGMIHYYGMLCFQVILVIKERSRIFITTRDYMYTRIFTCYNCIVLRPLNIILFPHGASPGTVTNSIKKNRQNSITHFMYAFVIMCARVLHVCDMHICIKALSDIDFSDIVTTHRILYISISFLWSITMLLCDIAHIYVA